jgi:hypothetical protein
MASGGPDSWQDSSIQYAWDLAHLYHTAEEKFSSQSDKAEASAPISGFDRWTGLGLGKP